MVDVKRSRLRTKLERLVASANRRRPENQPKLTVEEAQKLAEDCVSSALARAQEHCASKGLPPGPGKRSTIFAQAPESTGNRRAR